MQAPTKLSFIVKPGFVSVRPNDGPFGSKQVAPCEQDIV
jgi:hypothetical protein